VVNFFIHPRHAEYFLDNYPGYWALFGLVVAVVMVLVMKKIVQPLLKRPEEKDDD
jgi:flagellar biosynthesis/type III secretory pathway M-ring protein FliF/YscJ